MWFAAQEDEELVFNLPMSPLSDEDLNYHVEEIESRLKSRCRGLLEIQRTGVSENHAEDRSGSQTRWSSQKPLVDV